MSHIGHIVLNILDDCSTFTFRGEGEDEGTTILQDNGNYIGPATV
jgi:hypothetical protein